MTVLGSTDSGKNSIRERRDIDRKEISAPIKVKFSVEYEGEIVDISPEGVGIKFHPLGSESLNVGNKLRVLIDMNGRAVSMQGEIRRLSEKFGHIVLGLEYDRNEITLFEAG